MKIYRPDPKLIDLFTNIKSISHMDYFKVRFIHKDSWYKNNRSFVLQELLPAIKPPLHVWRAVVEGYLTDVMFDECHVLDDTIYYETVIPHRLYGFEQVMCDGSSLVPDVAYKWGKIKDPWAVGHDLICMTNRYHLCDVYGKKWSRSQADKMYRDGWYSQHSYIVGTLWWFGLVIGSWIPWNIKANCKPECKEFINNNVPLCKECRTKYSLGKYDPSIICLKCINLWNSGVE